MALTTLSNVKAKLGITNADSDDVLTALVAQAAQLIKSWLHRDLESASYTEYPRGYGTRHLRLRQWPITTISSVRIDPTRAFTSSTTLLTAGTDYSLLDNGLLLRLNGVWPAARENRFGLLADAQVPSDGIIKVIYTAGYGTIPDDITLAADLLVARLWTLRTTGEAYMSESLEDYSYSRGGGDNADPMKQVKALLAPYRRLRL